MPIHHAVLALLAGGTSHGYELKARFEESVGPQWGDLNIGHIYQVLDRIERDGLVTRRVVPQADRPDRLVYRLTRAGRDELERWLGTPFVRRAYRDDLFLKLFAASRLGRDSLETLVHVQREAYIGELAALRELRRGHRDDPLVSLLIEAAVLHTKADLRVIELAEAKAEPLEASAAGHSEAEDPPEAAAEPA
ncbi:PadR family transcriptional regulator [soil metagenome]